MQDSVFRLVSNTVDVVIKRTRLPKFSTGAAPSALFAAGCRYARRPVANGRLDVDSPVTLMAEHGHGLFGSPGIEGHRQGLDGSRF